MRVRRKGGGRQTYHGTRLSLSEAAAAQPFTKSERIALAFALGGCALLVTIISYFVRHRYHPVCTSKRPYVWYVDDCHSLTHVTMQQYNECLEDHEYLKCLESA